ncbi:DEAD/DEAH box helicase [Mycolicibacterium sp. P9-22]|uniref:C-terminal helicase domain-containing protein n=1 Tax=Mycolicibacterium sp. P9-22 TaxID=2024613 RepID=UPI0011EBEC6B|nr:DEAD/DEAH box helicase [Mycolicibacterium sp. P9-22]KAA0115077.1 helicase [Mycolicibacterium sp. P9-22]
MTPPDVAQILAGLKGFQRDAVEHIIDRLYRSAGGSGRYLVADETGLGKSVVARGVIASAIAELQDAAHIDRIDVVYICSNTDLAKQNLRRLNVTGDPHLGITSRLTLLALETRHLASESTVSGKKVNLVSFTPGTSFEMGWQTGSQEERQLLHILLHGVVEGDSAVERTSALFFQGGVASVGRFQAGIAAMRIRLGAGPDSVIQREFTSSVQASGLREQFDQLCEQLQGCEGVPPELRRDVNGLTASLRGTLAAASVESLEPDLVILDEFQRFRHLIDPGSGSAASELAHNLFNYRDARVLLLSATPYKPYTTADGDADDDHYRDFMTTLEFLAKGDAAALERIRRGFRNYRQALVNGSDAVNEATVLRDELLPFMSRSERPRLEEGRDLLVRRVRSDVPTVNDLRDYAALQSFAREIDSPVSLDYWKSIPYFASFMEGYRPGERARHEIESGSATAELNTAVSQLRSIDPVDIRNYGPVDYGNARLRAFAEETIDQGWWRLLWVPPSLPYFSPGDVYLSFSDGSVTKRLIFSAWSSVPTSVASLLSYEAERRMIEGSTLTENTAEAKRAVSSRLDYVLREGRASSMSTLALFWPHPALAQLGDPLSFINESGDLLDAEDTRRRVDARIQSQADASDEAHPDAASQAFFAWPGEWPDGVYRQPHAAAYWLAGRGGGTANAGNEAGGALQEHAKVALEQTTTLRWHEDLALLAMHSPGNVAYRALARICAGTDVDLQKELWRAAARLANGIRTLFNRMDVQFLIDQIYSHEQPYWKSVLRYCADGNLQSVLDEYCFQLKLELAGSGVDATSLNLITDRAIEALALRTSRYTARSTADQFARIPITVRFALRYGSAAGDAESARAPEVRNAFNSPFWPFVLASTSVGQEGIDFHWWSHSVVHWNLPSNPVDFEQREGRVNRFGGHAVRKNIASAHRRAALAGTETTSHPWQSAFDAAVDHPELGEFSPYWIYPGDARVERLIVHFPLSREDAQYERLRDSLTLYRMMLGQPRQEDMMELLRQRGVSESQVAQLDLRPPPSTGGTGPVD